MSNTINALNFKKAGYGAYMISGLINDTEVSYLEEDMWVVDAAQDEDAKGHEHAITYIVSKLNYAWENYYNNY